MFFIKSPVSLLYQQISREIPTMAFFNVFFIDFVIFVMYKGKIKQEKWVQCSYLRFFFLDLKTET